MVTDKNKPLMPVGFVGHGAPTLGLEHKGPTVEAWKLWGRSIPKPKAILMISAHWQDRPIHIGPTLKSGLIYDFFGFPEELYQVKYPAPPATELGNNVFSLLSKAGLKPIESPSRGLDHGAWVPLLHMFPSADIPVLQVSIGTRVPTHEHFALGRALAPLRSEGVFILGSGNITHNLRIVNFANRYAEPEGWAVEFDEWVRQKLENLDLYSLSRYALEAPSARKAHPTDDHYTPLLVAAAAGESVSKPNVTFPHKGFEYSTLSMRCVEFN